MRSPIVAMLWENWRLTRVEAASVWAWGSSWARPHWSCSTPARPLRSGSFFCAHAFFWFSIAKLNGGRFMDGYKPGFPFYLLYTRPVPTVVFVGVTMAYDAISVCGVVPRIRGFPGVCFRPAAAVVLRDPRGSWPSTLRTPASNGRPETESSSGLDRWSSIWPLFFLLQQAWASPPQVELSLAENALMILIGRRVVRAHGRRRSAAAPRRCRRDRASAGGDRADTRTGWSPCSGSRVPLRQRRGRRCGSSSSPAGCPCWRSAWRSR